MILFRGHYKLERQSQTEDFVAFCKHGASSLQMHKRFRAPVWQAFIFSFAWFYWRRLYIVGSCILMPPVLIADRGIHAPVCNFLIVGFLVLPPIMARRLYVTAFAQRCDRADQIGLAGADRLAYFAAAGGTSWLAGLLVCWSAGLLAGAVWISLAMDMLRGFAPHVGAGFLP